MPEYTLLVMAAGMGSRFGGLKQIEPVGPNGEFIIDYSIYDAIKAGFNKVIFVIKKEHESVFKETIGHRIEGKIKVEYVFQELDDLPDGYQKPINRTKPWGTGQAIYSAKEFIKGPFAVINADDFYGYEAYEILIDFLKNNESRNHYLAVGYKVKNTLSENGSVKRGIARVKNGILEEIIESKVGLENDDIIARPLDGSKAFKINNDDLATVNLFGLTTNFLRDVQLKFPEFLDKHINELEAEYLMPNIITDEINDGSATVYVKSTPSKWHGVTYKEDKESVVNAINNYINEGKYPKDLWE